jgi:hypothetical protein
MAVPVKDAREGLSVNEACWLSPEFLVTTNPVAAARLDGAAEAVTGEDEKDESMGMAVGTAVAFGTVIAIGEGASGTSH